MQLQTTTGGYCVLASGPGSVIILGAGITFGACADRHIAASAGGEVYITTNYTISGSATNFHYEADTAGLISITGGITVTVSANLTFLYGFAYITTGAILDTSANTYSLGVFTVTAPRFVVAQNAIIYTNGGGANYFPGNVAGTQSTGGYCDAITSTTLPGALAMSGALSGVTTLAASGAVTLSAAVASTSSTTGTVIVTGGVGISGDSFTGGHHYDAAPTSSAKGDAAYTLVLADAFTEVTFALATTARALTVPLSTGGGGVAFVIGTKIYVTVTAGTTGVLTITPTAGVTLRGKTKLNFGTVANESPAAVLWKIAADVWLAL
jgi:hypothetical protein